MLPCASVFNQTRREYVFFFNVFFVYWNLCIFVQGGWVAQEEYIYDSDIQLQ
jgi:hypothetical protein